MLQRSPCKPPFCPHRTRCPWKPFHLAHSRCLSAAGRFVIAPGLFIIPQQAAGTNWKANTWLRSWPYHWLHWDFVALSHWHSVMFCPSDRRHRTEDGRSLAPGSVSFSAGVELEGLEFQFLRWAAFTLFFVVLFSVCSSRHTAKKIRNALCPEKRARV